MSPDNHEATSKDYEFAAEVARHLGGGWGASKSRLEMGTAFSFHLDGPNGAVIILGSDPRSHDNGILWGCLPSVPFCEQQANPSHRVSLNLTAEEFATQITQHLLPDYLPMLTVARGQARKHEEDKAEHVRLAEYISETLPGSNVTHLHPIGPDRVSLAIPGQARGEITFMGRDRLTVLIEDLPKKAIMRIVEILADAQ